MAGTFDFCLGTRVVEEIPPEETTVVSFRGWDFTSRPNTPYRAKFRVMLYGLRWYLNGAGTAFDVTTDPTHNAGRLRDFYIANRQWDTFTFAHETLGNLTVRFTAPAVPPASLPRAGGLIAPFEVTLVHHNPGY